MAIERGAVTINEKVKRSAEYRKFVQKKELSHRETALMQLTLRIAEQELSKRRVLLAEKEGDLRVSEQQTKFALLLGGGQRFLATSGRFLITPFSEMPAVFSEESTYLEGSSTKQNSSVETKKGTQAPEDPSKIDLFVEGLPKWLQAALLFAKSRVARMSPMTVAVLFVLSIAASVYYGKHARANLEHSYDLLVKDIDRHKSEKERLQGAESENEQLKEQVLSLEAVKDGLNNQVRTLREDLQQASAHAKEKEEDSRKSLEERTASHEEELRQLRAGLEASTLSKIKSLETKQKERKEKISDLEEERDRISRERDKIKSELENVHVTLTHQSMIVTELNRQVNQLEVDSRHLHNLKNEYRSLSAFCRDLLGAVQINLLDSGTKYISRNRRTFRKTYSRLFSRDADHFRSLGLPSEV